MACGTVDHDMFRWGDKPATENAAATRPAHAVADVERLRDVLRKASILLDHLALDLKRDPTDEYRSHCRQCGWDVTDGDFNSKCKWCPTLRDIDAALADAKQGGGE